MYQDPRSIKKHLAKTKLDDFDNEKLSLVIGLMNKQPATVVRTLINIGIEEFHRLNSIGIKPEQEDLFNELNRA